ncbi:bifunctional diguanylate cyclase/phosphodiesterase [Anaerocolumna sp. MB42-C2]|uniref:bifunctional diguanylate cyclase/phosphodiesterase n=1 Tax=Anaerocolumna sp. MB42-C2 TaxID=3070997 RepID=UPI0027DF8A70|nr:EAL domain-containing protein [Anaerocolumna sp. MB42-C2]WMJ90646.1 EAL domain-containing protein [Anaerocolumna sp. MB42-C2]
MTYKEDNSKLQNELNESHNTYNGVYPIFREERDNQTQLFNKKTVLNKIEKHLKENLNKKLIENHSFLLIDIDNLKRINETCGHIYGDIVLETFAAYLAQTVEDGDILGRIDGDGFVVIHNTIKDKDDIYYMPQTICSLVRENLPGLKEDVKLTVSIGISNFPKDGTTYEELLQKADIALNKAKISGKDKFVIYNSELNINIFEGEMEQKRNKKKKKQNYEDILDAEKRLLNYAFDILSEGNSVEVSIHKIFTEIGKYYNLSRITIFENETINQKARVTYEWLNAGISPCIAIPKSDYLAKQYKEMFINNSIYYFEDITRIDISSELKWFYEQMNIKSLVQCAINDSNQLIGTVNFEDCEKARIWPKSQLNTLLIITKVVSNYILQLRNKEELDNEILFTQAMLNNQKLSNYAIKAGTYELLYVSEYTEKLFPNVKLGELCYKAIFGRSKPCDTCPLNGLDHANKRYSVEAYNKKLGAWLSTTASTFDMPNGQKMNLLCSSDVTGFMERVKSKDNLTGLLTLSKFEAEAMKLIASSKEFQYAIVYSDFDKFKYINDEWGYSIGNDILKFYAEKILKHLNPMELFCRISGDTFVCLFIYKDREEILDRIKIILQAIIQDYKTCYPKINPIIISGIYFMTKEDKVLSIAMDKANMARKRLKGFHKSTLSIYDENLHKTISKEKMIENRMHTALTNHEFIVYMQPKIELRSLNIIGAEALVRWKTHTGEIMNPSEFIPIFEKNGFILELDFYVYEEAFKMLRRWLNLGKNPLIISVNVSRLHIDDDLFIQKLEFLIRKYNLPTNLIEIEITESIFLNGLDRLKRFLGKLSDKGFLISIDDFGSGFSSLNLLKTLPVDILKLDKDFLTYDVMGEKDKIVIANIINLAKGLGLKVISEGVETLDQARFLKENHCDMVQGYFFYKPMPMEELEKLLS